MYIISLVALYLLAGMVVGLNHVVLLKNIIIPIGLEEKKLKEFVSMYQYSPKGAEYYAQLQELYINKVETLDEYYLYEKNQFQFELIHFSLSALFWPYYLFLILVSKNKRKEWSE